MLQTRQYPVFVDGREGAYGVSFPDLPGIVAMGGSIEEALQNAAEALADAAEEAAERGASLPAPSRAEDLSPPEDCILTTFIVLRV